MGCSGTEGGGFSLHSVQPSLNLVCREWVCLAAKGEGSFKNLEAPVEGEEVEEEPRPAPDVSYTSPFDFWRVGAGKARHIRQQALAVVVTGKIVEAHRERADRTGEAVQHPIRVQHWLVLEAGGDQGSLVDARPAVWPGEQVRADLQPPVQHRIECVHVATPVARSHSKVLPQRRHVKASRTGALCRTG